MKIVMIGPAYPYKTGLSYYVALLYKQLSKNHDVSLISYTMQYPKILYKKPQKDYEDDVLKIDEVEFLLNTANPFSCISVANKINRLKPDLVIFQWLHPYFAPCYSIISSFLKDTKILFMCHNVFPHERFPLDRFLTRFTLKKGDIYTVHSKSDEADLLSILPNANVSTTVHPAYDFFKQSGISQLDARDKLGLAGTDKVLLFFGLVREYKGLKHLINALGIMKQEGKLIDDIKLLIAGDFAGARAEYDELILKNDIKDMVYVTDGHIPIGEVEKYFTASDLVVLPYESATQSGVIQVAYGFNKPVLATNVGGLPDVVIPYETGYIVEPFSPEAISKAIVDFYENSRDDEFAEGIERERYKYSWERMEQVIMDLYL